MRLAFTSDLHVDYKLEVAGEVARRASKLNVDVLVVAGDVCPRLGRLQAALRVLAEHVPKVMFVPGNHDLWCVAGETTGRRSQPYDSRTRYMDVLPEVAEKAGVVYLGISPHVEQDVGFVGVTGWYDYSLRARSLDERVPMDAYKDKKFESTEWMDGKFVHWPDEEGRPMTDAELARWMADKLAEQFRNIDPQVNRVVVVTHVLTHREMVAPTGDVKHDFVLAFLGSDLLGTVIDAQPKVIQVLSGHVHAPLTFQATGLDGPYTCEVSPVGYPREYRGTLKQHLAERVRPMELKKR